MLDRRISPVIKTCSEEQTEFHNALHTKLTYNHDNLSATLDNLKVQIESSIHLQESIRACLWGQSSVPSKGVESVKVARTTPEKPKDYNHESLKEM